MRFAQLGLVSCVLSALLFTACGGGEGNGNGTATRPRAATPSGPAVSDEAYLKVICTGLVTYQDSLLAAKDVDAIRKVITDYAESMEAINPPEDLQTYHADFIKYLRDSEKDPTSPVTTSPPRPENAARERLAGKVTSVPECKYPTFLGEKRPTPSP
jgi:hypothetical protein